MIVGIHQPNFLPWLGYFCKMARSDVLVFLDSVPFAKGSYTNRVRIKAASGPQWLTVPVLSKGKLGQPIQDVRCNEALGWRRKALKALETNYRSCPHYQPYADQIGQILLNSDDNLADLNIRLIEYVAGQLNIHPRTLRSSQMQSKGKATELLIELSKELGADTYLSGSGGANYQDEQAFQRAGIRLIYTGYVHPIYPQPFGEFQAGMSILDLLVSCGPESRTVLLGSAS